MAALKGQNLRVFMEGKALAAAMQCELNIRLNVSPFSTKDTESDFADQDPTSIEWSVKAKALVFTSRAPMPDAITQDNVMNLVGETVRIELATASGSQNREAQWVMLAGYAIISDIQLTAQNQQHSEYDVTFTGKANMLTDLRTIITADDHNIRTASGNIVTAPHET